MEKCGWQMHVNGKFRSCLPSVAFHIETSHLIFLPNQMTGFYMKCNTGLKWVNLFISGVNRNPVEKEIKLNMFYFVGLEMIFWKISAKESFSAKLHVLDLQHHLNRISIRIFSHNFFERSLYVDFRYKNKFADLLVYIFT